MVSEIGVRELKAALDDGERVVLVDVREPWEHALAKLPGALLLPLGELGERAGEVKVPEGATVVVYCHHGVRSLRGAIILEAAGVTAKSLRGGIDRWSMEIDVGVPRY